MKSAAEDESNLVLFIRHQRAAESFRHLLWSRRESIADLVRSHLHLRKDDGCTVLTPDSWIQGGFNICVLIDITVGGSPTRLVFRCPMPHKLAEAQYPGTIDEKVRCEVAAYIWMQEYCSDIRIPRLYAFGFVDGSQFTHIKQAPFYTRISRYLWRWMHRILGLPLLSNYAPTQNRRVVPAVHTLMAYMLLEYIGPQTGKMLSLTWTEHLHDSMRRARLFQGMSRIILSLARLPQPTIGSFVFNPSDSTITLTNRPLMCNTMIFEHSGTPRTIQPFQTYQDTDSFVSDMLTQYDNHLLHDPHAVRDEDDARERMAIRTLLRAVSHHFINRSQRSGPFILQLTDFHQSNIFVDDDWNITCLIDLEWICALPAEILSVPYWLTNCSIDDIIDERYDKFNEARQIFLGIMEDEEAKNLQHEHNNIQLTRTMRDSWVSKRVWFWACIRSLNAWPFIFEDHLLPKFSADRDLVAKVKLVSTVWQENVEQIVKTKVVEEERYQEELRRLLEDDEGLNITS
ncbi:hypothetical protein HRR83_000448 [Exophiala dermatitidis]|nr:hypothetical protein HRR74_000450 [Exophiala dermatitidis]KAJ4528331.1 hypothetical protein HRR73_000954 [Exophiala dermatitidis]KAJ4531281.1 hypothetical protein HRR76_008947 [Exophiala dermatitidis]KAJ4558443.1 hypothetical protein HRR77_000449 [Exophiala dermatitidis]KAJ4581520.1 hypothetical protein HRR79_000547 [Exophiala dermatitidis]